MARRAIGREIGSDVRRIQGAREVLLVAAVAVCRQRQIVVVGMARRASHRDMRAGQRERRLAVIEAGACPIGGAVARGAGGREPDRCMRRSVGAVVVFRVAGVAVRRNGCEVVIGVARGASYRRVRACQREHRVVIKGRGSPRSRVVAKRATGREAPRNVIRIGGSSEILRMARIAIRGGSCEDVVNVARGTRHGDVGTSQREGRLVVIEGCTGQP